MFCERCPIYYSTETPVCKVNNSLRLLYCRQHCMQKLPRRDDYYRAEFFTNFVCNRVLCFAQITRITLHWESTEVANCSNRATSERSSSHSFVAGICAVQILLALKRIFPYWSQQTMAVWQFIYHLLCCRSLNLVDWHNWKNLMKQSIPRQHSPWD